MAQSGTRPTCAQKGPTIVGALTGAAAFGAVVALIIYLKGSLGEHLPENTLNIIYEIGVPLASLAGAAAGAAAGHRLARPTADTGATAFLLAGAGAGATAPSVGNG